MKANLTKIRKTGGKSRTKVGIKSTFIATLDTSSLTDGLSLYINFWWHFWIHGNLKFVAFFNFAAFLIFCTKLATFGIHSKIRKVLIFVAL